jgi:hypothetical protein
VNVRNRRNLLISAAIVVVLILIMSLLPSSAIAQDSPAPMYECQHYAPSVQEPVSSRLRQVLDCYSGGLIEIAAEVPADKYTAQRILGETVGHNVGHVAFISSFACAKISGLTAPKPPKVAGEADKDGMVKWFKSSMEFCKRAFSKLSDARLGESVRWDGFNPSYPEVDVGASVTRYSAALWVTNVLIERYGAFAGYFASSSSPFQPHATLSPVDSVPLVTGPSSLPKATTPPTEGGSASGR